MSSIYKTPVHKARELKLGTKRKGRNERMWYLVSKNGKNNGLKPRLLVKKCMEDQKHLNLNLNLN